MRNEILNFFFFFKQSAIKQKWVRNLSSKPLSLAQSAVLEKGFNFAIVPRKIPILDIVSGVEEGLRQINDAALVTTARSKVAGVLKHARVPQRNMTKDEEKALKELIADEDIKILKADKGNCTVVMDSKDYNTKIYDLLNDDIIYRKLATKFNPLNKITKTVNEFVYRLYTSKKIKQDKYYWLHSSKGVVPRFYGLPKIHKTDVPLRPIVSFINSPTYNLSKFLANIISALVTNRFSVNNSIDFIERIKNIAIEEDEILVSFDVVSLFTSVPVDHAIDIVVNLLDCDDSLSSRTQLSSQDIKTGLEICSKSTLFSFRNVLYRQTFGTPMGSCISPILANIFMEYVENTALTTFHTPPKLWLRYVDDTFCILKQEHIVEFHQHINSVCRHIQFTMEEEQESSLPFLDVLVLRHNNTLCTQVYRKPTHTDRYLHFDSHHPKHQKLAVAKTLHDRAKTHNTNPVNAQQETTNVRSVLQLNGFPLRLSFPVSKTKHHFTTNDLQHFTTIPYLQGTSEKIRRILNEAGLKVSFTLVKTIGNFLTVPKDPIQEHEKSQLVYKIPCADCEFVYIGQTKRDLKSRIAEHKRAVKNQEPEKSALCEHLMLFDHCINWNQAVVLKYVDRFYRRLTSESWYIHAHPYVINRSDGEALPAVYRSLAKSTVHLPI